jgi:hypothetical protein
MQHNLYLFHSLQQLKQEETLFSSQISLELINHPQINKLSTISFSKSHQFLNMNISQTTPTAEFNHMQSS